jgi:hypothetical protein
MEHTAEEDPAIVIVGVRPEVAVAVGEYEAPCAVAVVGAVDVKLTV